MTRGLTEGWVEGAPRLRVLRRRGTGRRMLMLHGVLRCGADFFSLLPFLDEAMDLTFLDQRGHGGSEWAAGYGVADYVSDSMRVVREMGPEGLVVFGHSLGGMVAAAIAEAAPVAGVVLEDPPFETMGSRIFGTGWHQVFMGFREALSEGRELEGLFERLGRVRIVGADGTVSVLSQLRDEVSLRWSADCLARLDSRVLDPLVEGRWLEGFGWSSLLTRACCPVLLLQGDGSAGGALTDGDLVDAGGGSERVSRVFFEGKGHQLHATEPERVASCINRFVGGLDW